MDAESSIDERGRGVVAGAGYPGRTPGGVPSYLASGLRTPPRSVYARAVSSGVPTSGPARPTHFRAVAVDAAIVAVACVVVVLNAVHAAGHHVSGIDERATSAFAVAAYAAMLLRRRWPRGASIGAVAATAGYLSTGGDNWLILPAAAVTLYHLASASRRRERLLIVAIGCGIALVAVPAVSLPAIWRSAGGHELSIAGFAACCIALAVGDATRSRRAYIAEAEERVRHAERERTREARQQVMQERMRIARDLHDSVGHHIAVINAQAGMAATVFDTQPDAARAALSHIKAESRAALDDMRATVGLLRQPDDTAAPVGPPPGLHAVADLVAGFRRSGLPVHLTVDGTAPTVPDGVGVAAYRILQESLTNVTKHGGGAPARVRIEYTEDAVTVRVDNELADRTRPTPDAEGHGLAGMHERANAAGGTLSAGPGPDGGYRVRAVLPLARAGRP